MSFEQRHRRQVSSADQTIAKEDGKPEDFDKTILHIQRKLDQIPSQYKQQSEVFNPLEQVIDMMKSSNLKERKKDLDANVRTLDKAMESVVKAHYDGFNKAIKNYTQILGLVTSTGTNNATLTQNAAKCNALFTSRSHSVNTMYLQSLEYSYMIEILDKIEAIKKVPDQYQEAYNSQQYLNAAKILVEAVEQLYQDDLLRIGALVELQAEIVAKKNTFHEVALELLHNLIYLKDSADLVEELSDSGAANGSSSEDTRKSLTSMEAKDPLTIRLELMDQLVSSFFVLGKASQAINKILDRLRSELRHVIQKAVATVKKRHESNPVLLQQILTRPPRGEVSHEYPNLFYDMLQLVFEKAKEVLVFHRYVTELFESKLRAEREASDQVMDLEESEEIKPPRVKSGNLTSAMSAATHSNFSMATDSESFTMTYRLDHVWEEFQKELQALIGYFIDAPAEGTMSAASAAKKQVETRETHHSARLFSFSSSSAFTLYEISETQSFQYRSMDLGEPSPYNLPAIYPLISSFCEQAAQITGVPLASSRLQDWMDSFISTTLLAVLKMDSKLRVEAAVQSAEAFKSRDAKTVKSSYVAEDARRPLLNSTLEVYRCIKELFDDTIAMPLYAPQIHGIMETCLMSYFDQCRIQYDSYVRDSEVGKTVKNSEFQKLVMTDPQWRRILRLFKIGGNVNTANLSVSVDSNSSSESPTTGESNSPKPSSSAPISAATPAPSLNPNNRMSSGPTVVIHSVPGMMMRSGSGAGEGHGTQGVDHEESEYMANLMDFEVAWHTGTTNAGVPIALRHMIYDPHRLAHLAALHDSCYWIADKVASLDRTDGPATSSGRSHMRESSAASGNGASSGVGSNSNVLLSPTGVASGASSIGSSAPTSGKYGMTPMGSTANVSAPASNNLRRLQRRESKDGPKFASQTPLNVFRPRLSSQLTNLTWMFKDLSDQCLHNIYVDFRLQTCYFLDGLAGHYVYAAEDRQPDLRVVELNASLATAYQFLQAYLPSTKLKYLLAGLPLLMSSLLIESLKSHIETINRNGVVKMVRNIFTLQQNLTGMTTFNEEPFDQARRYYELLNLNIEEVYQYVALHHNPDDHLAYSLNQYRTVLEIIANPKSRTLTDEQEKDLRDKYMLLPHDGTAHAKRNVH
jgi:hypothetical protein